MHTSLQRHTKAASLLHRPPSSGHITLLTQHLRPLGSFSGWRDALELLLTPFGGRNQTMAWIASDAL